MARPKSFDQEKLLQKAMVLFWEKGYERTSLKDLEEAFGLKPPSIYNTFGNKQTLFLSVIDCYLEQVVDNRIGEYLNQSPNAIDDLEAFLRSSLGYWMADKPRFGCLLTNTAIETVHLTKEIDEKVQGGLTRLRDAFYGELVRAQASGDLFACQDLAAFATMLLTSYQGLLVLSRLQVADEMLQHSVDSIIRTLSPPGTLSPTENDVGTALDH
ncbi:MAG: TetR/AcrR family transcriptional regulator [Leptolyngbyaceae cyanobacterium MAG.088]|nr:TetR/AcrR family transcriptional regulator [Leptolyngbyaceae cyanobacterium MAG.088]